MKTGFYQKIYGDVKMNKTNEQGSEAAVFGTGLLSLMCRLAANMTHHLGHKACRGVCWILDPCSGGMKCI